MAIRSRCRQAIVSVIIITVAVFFLYYLVNKYDSSHSNKSFDNNNNNHISLNNNSFNVKSTFSFSISRNLISTRRLSTNKLNTTVFGNSNSSNKNITKPAITVKLLHTSKLTHSNTTFAKQATKAIKIIKKTEKPFKRPLPTPKVIHTVRGDKYIESSGLIYYGNRSSAKPCRFKAFVLMMINSKPQHFHRRRAIRKTWADTSFFTSKCKHPYALRVLFVVGLTGNSTMDNLIEKESIRNDDMVLADFIDNMKNLTEKTVLSMAWSIKYCDPVFVYKGDDDVFVNTFYLFQYLQSYANAGRTKKFWVGRVNPSLLVRRVVRSNSSKYYVPYEDYSNKYFPVFPSGFSYVMSGDVVRGLLKFVPTTKKLKTVDDAYVALLGRKFGITARNDRRFHFYVTNNPRRRYSFIMVRSRFSEHGIIKESQQLHMYTLAKASKNSRFISHHCPKHELLQHD